MKMKWIGKCQMFLIFLILFLYSFLCYILLIIPSFIFIKIRLRFALIF